ncbi:MAG TPA: SMC family ATPase [Anaerolineales bacterium]
MIPLHLSISGFLSYHEQVDLDFTTFSLACISGANGAGKSSLLDAITWALFGQARKRDDSLINAQSNAAEVCLDFTYEGNIYRVQRSKPRDKTGMLELYILQDANGNGQESLPPPSARRMSSTAVWKPLTERTSHETEDRIQKTLRLDYETFVNAAFFLQGKADQFTQQRPGDRKRILGMILGLEVWETYRQRAAERRKGIGAEIDKLDGRLHEITSELSEEETRRARLAQLETDLARLSRERLNQEAALENIRKIAATLAEQRKLVDMLARQAQAGRSRLSDLEARYAERCQEQASFGKLLSRSAGIEAAYNDWQAVRKELEDWEATAARFREQEKRRQGPLDEINAAHARLEQELQTLQAQEQQSELVQFEISRLQTQVSEAKAAIERAEADLAQRAQLDNDLQTARQNQAEARAENPRLRAEMDELKERITRLDETEGAACPVCGQPLSLTERQNLIDSLNVQGKELGDRFRANQLLLRDADEKVSALEKEIKGLTRVENDLRANTQTAANFSSRLELLEKQRAAWLAEGAPRMQGIAGLLQEASFAPEARRRLAEVDAELKTIGYDAAAHDAARQAELKGRAAEEEHRQLERAQAALTPLKREISDLQSQITLQQVEVARQQEEHTHAAATLAAEELQAPDLYAAERALLDIQEQENRLRLEVGAARQKVLVLEDLKLRRQSLEAAREDLARQVEQYRKLERAFSKDGVPALLIEQALPQIETRSNEILDRLSDGRMTVRFVTQSAYKDKRREDLKETLEIQISDGAGTRDYEMFSGGEAFRVNFAIRLALSEVLAQRAGARLQTLVIDEGFGSQDTQGRQRLIEAINLVRTDFAKVLVITHIDELKDAFPTRIEVEKTDMGSIVRVV